ncbi:MAG: DUF4230 domain-containing protein [Hamadaea sp.]|nr:DUF4230 domain-containing protein [Hamadaea sp.]
MSEEPTRKLRGLGYARGSARPGAPRAPEPDATGTAYILQPRSSGVGRRIFWFLMIVLLAVAAFLGVNLTGVLPEFHNPFAERTVVQQQPPLLLSIKDLSRYVASEGEFQVVIDLKKDRKYVPDFLINDRVLYIAYGTVQAYVDFGAIGQDSIKETVEGKEVEIILPSPQLEKPSLDVKRSYAFAEERGLFNRVGDFFQGDLNREREVMIKAEEELAKAADASELLERAEINTRSMLTGMLRSLGYTNVKITFTSA